MRLISILCLLVVLSLPTVSWAQAQTPQTPAAQPSHPAPDAAAPAAKPAAPASDAASTPSAATPVEPTRSPDLEPPSEGTPAAAPASAAEATPDATAPAAPSGGADAATAAAGTPTPTPAEAAIPSPGELGDRLVGDLPPPPEQKSLWTAPTPILTLHGYLRVRGELQDNFWLGRGPNDVVYAKDATNPLYAGLVTRAGLGPDPFSLYRPFDRATPQTMCASEGFTTDQIGTVCDVHALKYANMRFRFSPQINISEDIRIKSTFDILDNYVLGTAPVSYYGVGRATAPFPGSVIATGQLIVPRRVWAEVRNRDLGELRFGLMPDQWGLGMLYNAGNGLDDDYSTDLGRVMATTKLAGFYLSAAFDFMSEGMLRNPQPGEYRPAFDAGNMDDLSQYTFSVVRRQPDEDEDSVLARGDVLLNGGARFQLRFQDSVVNSDMKTLQTLDASLYTPDVWAQMRYGKLRLEVEAAWVLGKMRSLTNGNEQHVSQFGAAFEGELRLMGEKLGIFLYTGIATGDAQAEGLSSDANYFDVSGAKPGDPMANNHLVSTFRFHPAYRVDMILWRSILGQVTGAWYLKPGIGYDFVRDAFGQLFGARIDMIYSRATSVIQTWGNDANLGVELNGQIYWHSADGPDKSDGYHAALQYGVLFPMDGLGYYYKSVNLHTAQTLRLVLGVVF
jgi:uncharacterized protein (TIGR04551 family)